MFRLPSPLFLLPLVGAAILYFRFSPIKELLASVTGDSFWSGYAIHIATLLLVACACWVEGQSYLLFIWHCFIVPLGDAADQKSRLDKFYQGQAVVYDKTRAGLLRGRTTMLSMSAEHLRVLREKDPKKRIVWVDIGGGTGWNVEAMDAHFPISSFDAVYVVDLCQPLLDLAQKRFTARGWSNVTCLCEDACTFSLPEWGDGVHPRGSVGFITLSYSLSMIPSYHTLLDRIDYLLSPEDGLLSVVDFYTAGKEPSPHLKAIGGASKTCGWFSRWFWQIWFDFDHVSLSPGRRDYLEYRFGTVKSYNGRNGFIMPLIVRIPYYIWIGCSRSRDTSRFTHAFEVDGGNMIGNFSPTSPSTIITSNVDLLDIGQPSIAIPDNSSSKIKETIIDVVPPLSSFHYQLKHPWRLPYVESPVHLEFRTFIYSFTWEDPEKDLEHLELSKDDSILAITSAGDNVLHYAINAQLARIHSVDMNPCQGHLLELKLAAIKALEYEDFFALFGEGKIANFRKILDSKLSPYLSSPAYQFWRINVNAFNDSFYRRGYSGWAIRIAHWIFRFAGVSDDVKRLCEAQTIEEQDQIWKKSLRNLFVRGSVVRRLIDNPVFLWNALGVPQNQKKAFTNEGSVYEFIRDTLDPIGSHALLSKGAYHYLLCLLGKYTRDSCPDYLTRRGFEALKADDGASMDSFRLHTDSVSNVLRGLPVASLTRAIIMDHLDWFAPGSADVDMEVAELYRSLSCGGMVFWRSAAKHPWYNEVFERAGFKLTALGMRIGPEKAIDRVNMYASFWRAVKVG